MKRVTLSSSSKLSWGSVASIVGLGVLLLLSHGCTQRGNMVNVNFATGSDTVPIATTTPTNPDATPTPTNPDDTPTPTPTSSPSDTPTPTPSDTPTATPTPDSTPTPAPTPELSCGMVVIRDLRISTDDSNGPEISFRPWADLDLANPNGSTINDLPVDPGVYRRVRFTLHKRVGDGSNGPGTGNPDVNGSIHLCGTWQGTPFDVFLDVTDNVDRRDPGGVTIDGDGPGKLFVIFDSSTWFDGIDLSTATVAPDGIVYLSHDSNSFLADQFKQNFEASVRLANKAHQ